MAHGNQLKTTAVYGSNSLAYAGDVKLRVRAHDKILSPEQIDSYFVNYGKIGSSEYIIGCMAANAECCFYSEPYTHTLDEVLDLIGKDRLWVANRDGYRMTNLLQHIIKEIIMGVNMLASKKITCGLNVMLNLENEIEWESDEALLSELHPKLGNIWDVPSGLSENCMWIGLGNLVKRIKQSTLGPDVKVHSEVKAFVQMLNKCCQGDISDTMTKHPALLTPEEKITFIVKVKNSFHEKIGFSNFCHDYTMPDWKQLIEGNSILEAAYNDELQKGLTYDSNAKGLIYFIRDCSKHVNDNQKGPTRILDKDLESMFDDMFPDFISHVFKSSVVKHDPFPNYTKNILYIAVLVRAASEETFHTRKNLHA